MRAGPDGDTRGGRHAGAMIRSILHLKAIPGRRDALLELFDRAGLRALVEEQRGLLGAEIAEAIDDEDDVLLIGEWASREQFERWADGPFPGGFLDAAAELVTVEPTHRLYHVVESVS